MGISAVVAAFKMGAYEFRECSRRHERGKRMSEEEGSSFEGPSHPVCEVREACHDQSEEGHAVSYSG